VELRSCDYYELFDHSKVIYQDIAFHSRFALDDAGYLNEATCFFLPTGDPVVVAILNSSLGCYLAQNAYALRRKRLAL